MQCPFVALNCCMLLLAANAAMIPDYELEITTLSKVSDKPETTVVSYTTIADDDLSRTTSVKQVESANVTSKKNIEKQYIIPFAVGASDDMQSFNKTNFLTPTEFDLFSKSLHFILDIKCRNDLNKTLWSIVAGETWALSMFDATAKSSFGLLSGDWHHFGYFDECINNKPLLTSDLDEIPVRPKYCLADVRVDGLTVYNLKSRNEELMNNATIHWGACVPASCAADDVATFLEHMLQRSVRVDEKYCQLNKPKLQITTGMTIFVLVILFSLFLAIVSTGYHIYLIYMEKQNEEVLKHEYLTIALLSFSLIENTQKLFQASREQLGLNSINGIKALSMLLILTGHALSFIYGGPLYNADFINEAAKGPVFEFITNSLLFVDTFLLLSGFLFCRILLNELERRRGQINVIFLYIGRWIRLTPAYMVIISFYMTWFPHIGNGPIWPQRIVREQERCQQSWWANILYINNYINTDKLCMFQSWYLAVDSQLFFLAPLGIYLFYKSRRNGITFLILMSICTAAVPFIVTYLKKLDPTFMIYGEEMTDLASNPYYIGSYIKTHMRASAYLIGLLTGVLVHVMQEKDFKLHPMWVRIIWPISFVAGFLSMYSIYFFYQKPFTNMESTLYAGFHKIGWNLSIAWLVLASSTGHSGWLERILSSRIFAPISRLTYCAYLSNGLIELYHSSTIRTPIVTNYPNMFNAVLCHIINTFILAFFLCLMFESPIHALERILLRRNATHIIKMKKENSSQAPSTSEEQVA